MKEKQMTQVTLSWDSNFGLTEATIHNGELFHLRVCKNGSSADHGLFTDNLAFIKHIHKVTGELIDYLEPKTNK